MAGKEYIGEIKHIYNNYGIVSTEIDNTLVSFFFFITPDMLYKGKDLRISKKVKFRLVNSQIRDVKVKIATDLESLTNEKTKKYRISKKKIEKVEDYHHYIFSHFYGENDETILVSLRDEDTRFKEVILKWVLKIENIIKTQLVKILSENSIKSIEVFQSLEKDRALKSLKDRVFKSLKSRYIFRAEFELFKIEQSKDGNLASFELVDVPLTLFFENLTIDELGKIYKFILEEFDGKLKKTIGLMNF